MGLFDYRTRRHVCHLGIQERQSLGFHLSFAIIQDPGIHLTSPRAGGTYKYHISLFGKLSQGGIATFVIEIVDEYVFGSIEMTGVKFKWSPDIHDGYI